METRVLTEADAAAFWKLRLEGLEREPTAFGESADEARRVPLSTYAERLRSSSVDKFVIGTFVDGTLAGVAGFHRETAQKRRHLGRIWGVYVSPEYRGKRIGRAMIEALLAEARKSPELRYILLSVASSQTSARQMYLNLGLRIWGKQPAALMVEGKALDEEHMILELPGKFSGN